LGLIREIGDGPLALDTVAFIYFIAIQISAALSGGCSALLTNDRDLPEIPGLRILQLEDFAA
jgi:hypothetical protein